MPDYSPHDDKLHLSERERKAADQKTQDTEEYLANARALGALARTIGSYTAEHFSNVQCVEAALLTLQKLTMAVEALTLRQQQLHGKLFPPF